MSSVLMVGIDCSECGERAVEYAIKHAKQSGAPIFVAHVIEWSPFSFSTAAENAERHKRRDQEIQRAHDEVIDQVVERLKSEGIDAVGLVRHGHVAKTLVELAGEHNVTNIILGRHGTSVIKMHVIGSVGSRLVQIADCAVTIVP